MRTLREIAIDIQREWKNVYFGAVPYLTAMKYLVSVDDQYINDSGESVVRHFLANAGSWRGESARRIKTELRSMLT